MCKTCNVLAMSGSSSSISISSLSTMLYSHFAVSASIDVAMLELIRRVVDALRPQHLGLDETDPFRPKEASSGSGAASPSACDSAACSCAMVLEDNKTAPPAKAQQRPLLPQKTPAEMQAYHKAAVDDADVDFATELDSKHAAGKWNSDSKLPPLMPPAASAAAGSASHKHHQHHQHSHGKDIRYLPICDDEFFCVGVFFLPKGSTVPLHDHPGMCVISKLLHGTVHLTSYDFKFDPDAVPENSDAYSLATKSFEDDVTGPMAPPMILYPRGGGNLHTITALTNSILLDVQLPPYSPDDGRSCTFFSALPYDRSTADSVTANLIQNISEPLFKMVVADDADQDIVRIKCSEV